MALEKLVKSSGLTGIWILMPLLSLVASVDMRAIVGIVVSLK